jgi:sugar O-acyltransferase (sialic acid O-acetyltransferase NeuD family)
LKKLIVVGAGGFGREVLGFARSIPQNLRDWEVYGIIDDNSSALRDYDVGINIIGSIKDYCPEPDEVFTCAIAEPRLRLEICKSLLQRKANFVNIVVPSAIIGENALTGIGLIMGVFSAISVSSRVGNFTIINSYSSLGHDAFLEDGCTLSAYCEISGGAKLAEGSFMGSHAVVLPNVKVGRYVKIGAGSVVLKNVRDGVTVFGNPAREVSE